MLVFLQADTKGVELLRAYLDLEMGNINFNLAGNSTNFVRWARQAYQAPCTYLPNMYYLDGSATTNTPTYKGGVLRIGCFGATRPQKNLISACAAALQMHEELKVDTEFWFSGGRADGGQTIINAIKAMTQGIPSFTLKELNWTAWPRWCVLPAMIRLRQRTRKTNTQSCQRSSFALGIAETS